MVIKKKEKRDVFGPIWTKKLHMNRRNTQQPTKNEKLHYRATVWGQYDF